MTGTKSNFIVRKLNVRKDRRAVLYLPLDYIISDWVVVRREGEKIVIEPIKITGKNSEER
ncbi:hypothetical protein [Thermococcus onnurineus]|uniref:hypothetical protein n=1 Tax=Thermococcus onnurineus TaxID=342948 RepID=UPI0003260799|nr:hypothetical protein [Thermococcus onnurineus]